MTMSEMHDALRRLHVASDQIGHIPEEIVALLRAMLHERDGASERIARFLREVVSVDRL
jgi:hypothetical protein